MTNENTFKSKSSVANVAKIIIILICWSCRKTFKTTNKSKKRISTQFIYSVRYRPKSPAENWRATDEIFSILFRILWIFIVFVRARVLRNIYLITFWFISMFIVAMILIIICVCAYLCMCVCVRACVRPYGHVSGTGTLFSFHFVPVIKCNQ